MLNSSELNKWIWEENSFQDSDQIDELKKHYQQLTVMRLLALENDNRSYLTNLTPFKKVSGNSNAQKSVVKTFIVNLNKYYREKSKDLNKLRFYRLIRRHQLKSELNNVKKIMSKVLMTSGSRHNMGNVISINKQLNDALNMPEAIGFKNSKEGKERSDLLSSKSPFPVANSLFEFRDMKAVEIKALADFRGVSIIIPDKFKNSSEYCLHKAKKLAGDLLRRNYSKGWLGKLWSFGFGSKGKQRYQEYDDRKKVLETIKQCKTATDWNSVFGKVRNLTGNYGIQFEAFSQLLGKLSESVNGHKITGGGWGPANSLSSEPTSHKQLATVKYSEKSGATGNKRKKVSMIGSKTQGHSAVPAGGASKKKRRLPVKAVVNKSPAFVSNERKKPGARSEVEPVGASKNSLFVKAGNRSHVGKRRGEPVKRKRSDRKSDGLRQTVTTAELNTIPKRYHSCYMTMRGFNGDPVYKIRPKFQNISMEQINKKLETSKLEAFKISGYS